MTNFRNLKARDLMQKDVITLPVDSSIQEALQTFEENRISGAPVVDECGRVIGVLTASDIVRGEQLSMERTGDSPAAWYLPKRVDANEQADDSWDPSEVEAVSDYSPGTNAPARVGEWMNPGTISVPPDASIELVCKVMVEQRIHRLLVLDEGRYLGILTTFDIVSAIARGVASPHSSGPKQSGKRAH
jgi:CBS domain-containing protein